MPNITTPQGNTQSTPKSIKKGNTPANHNDAVMENPITNPDLIDALTLSHEQIDWLGMLIHDIIKLASTGMDNTPSSAKYYLEFVLKKAQMASYLSDQFLYGLTQGINKLGVKHDT